MTYEEALRLHEEVARRFWEGEPPAEDAAPAKRETDPEAPEERTVLWEEETGEDPVPEPEESLLEQLEDSMRRQARRWPGHMDGGKELG